jgi:hypothetical protein
MPITINKLRQYAKLHNVLASTLRDRLKGRAARVNLRANSYILTINEEEALITWISDLDKRGLPPRPAFIENMANYLPS